MRLLKARHCALLAGRISKGIRLLENSIAGYNERGDLLYATFTGLSLAQIYIEMLTSRTRPPLSVVLQNLGTVLGVQLSGVRRVEVLLEQIGRAPILDQRGVVQARVDAYFGFLHKLRNKPNLARQYLQKARGPAEYHGATLLVAKIDAALNETH